MTRTMKFAIQAKVASIMSLASGAPDFLEDEDTKAAFLVALTYKMSLDKGFLPKLAQLCADFCSDNSMGEDCGEGVMA